MDPCLALTIPLFLSPLSLPFHLVVLYALVFLSLPSLPHPPLIPSLLHLSFHHSPFLPHSTLIPSFLPFSFPSLPFNTFPSSPHSPPLIPSPLSLSLSASNDALRTLPAESSRRFKVQLTTEYRRRP